MELISLQFFLFLIGLLAVYYAVGRLAHKSQWIVLLVGSLAFYCLMGGASTLIYAVAVALITWGAGLGLDRLHQADKAARKQAKGRDAKKAIKQAFTRKRRVVLVLALAACIGILGYFKYWNVLLFYAGRAESTTSLGILLPLGISFYIFQSLGYLIDSYNAKYPPQRNFARHLLFVTYFPQIIQ
ncbi:MAG: MBOAT family protein, partial [Atopobiaceae bacterium]|nr:MBOAT family protein [Atopobiaceae bacterium]